jgi:hypothetical protein
MGCTLINYYRWALKLPKYTDVFTNQILDDSYPLFSSFFYNNYLNNSNFNNKSDKIKILRIRMAVCHCQWRCVNSSMPVTLCKHVNPSDLFRFFLNLELRALLTDPDASGKNVTPTDVF